MKLFFLQHPNEKDLALFAGGELGPLARWRIERHLESCAACEEAVADFFHLQGEIAELGELPALDWNAFAEQVLDGAQRERETSSEGAASGAREFSPRAGAGAGGAWRPTTWQWGLASASVLCAAILIRQWPGVQREFAAPEPASIETADAPEESPRPSAAPDQAEEDSAQAETAAAAPRAETEQAPGPDAPPESSGAAERAGTSRGSARPPIQERQQQPGAGAAALLSESFEMSDAAEASAAAENRARSAGEDSAVAAGGRSRLALARRISGEEPSQGERAVKTPPSAAAAVEPSEGFAVLPGGADQQQVGVAADGWIMVRSVDPRSRTVTITNVYVP